jgi:GntR family transcriptional repressor for pyruvate dehydrogenase complex
MPVPDRVDAVVAELEKMILKEGLEPGDRLPTERDLSSQLDVSRSVVREGIKRLQSLGRVISLQGSGTRVASPNGEQVTAGYRWLFQHTDLRLEHLAAVRIPLETTIAALAAEHRTSAHLVRLEQAQARLADESRSLKSAIEADANFHAILAEATGNPIFQMILGPIQELLVESRRRTISRYGAILAYDHHQRILAAVQVQQPQQAYRAMADHLQMNATHLAELNADDAHVLTAENPLKQD